MRYENCRPFTVEYGGRVKAPVNTRAMQCDHGVGLLVECKRCEMVYVVLGTMTEIADEAERGFNEYWSERTGQ